MHAPTFNLAAATETGSLGIMFLKRFWSRNELIRSGQLKAVDVKQEYMLDQALLSVLRLSIEPVMQYLFSQEPTFDMFETWIVEITGQKPDPREIQSFNHIIAHGDTEVTYKCPAENQLSAEQWEFWNTNGYLIVPGVLSPEDCKNTAGLIYQYLDASERDPNTWYQSHPSKQKIMVQLFHHEQLEKNRRSQRIREVFEQLWQRNDLISSADRVSFNPPETPFYQFQGPDLHWDVSLKTPIPFGTQGLVYLSDTASNQGALTVVPGFQNRIETWLQSLEPQEDPRTADLHALGSVPLAAKAGDLLVWHHALPHGSSPNTAQLPRLVQYINYFPVLAEVHDEWI